MSKEKDKGSFPDEGLGAHPKGKPGPVPSVAPEKPDAPEDAKRHTPAHDPGAQPRVQGPADKHSPPEPRHDQPLAKRGDEDDAPPAAPPGVPPGVPPSPGPQVVVPAANAPPHADLPPPIDEVRFGEFVSILQCSSDPRAQQLASAITGTPVGSRTARGGQFLNRVDWNHLGPALVDLCMAQLHEQNKPTLTNSQGDVTPIRR